MSTAEPWNEAAERAIELLKRADKELEQELQARFPGPEHAQFIQFLVARMRQQHREVMAPYGQTLAHMIQSGASQHDAAAEAVHVMLSDPTVHASAALTDFTTQTRMPLGPPGVQSTMLPMPMNCFYAQPEVVDATTAAGGGGGSNSSGGGKGSKGGRGNKGEKSGH